MICNAIHTISLKVHTNNEGKDLARRGVGFFMLFYVFICPRGALIIIQKQTNFANSAARCTCGVL